MWSFKKIKEASWNLFKKNQRPRTWNLKKIGTQIVEFLKKTWNLKKNKDPDRGIYLKKILRTSHVEF